MRNPISSINRISLALNPISQRNRISFFNQKISVLLAVVPVCSMVAVMAVMKKKYSHNYVKLLMKPLNYINRMASNYHHPLWAKITPI
jgi:hypothetical protein